MSNRYASLAAALPLWLAGAVPGLAQAIDQPATASLWPLLLPNAAIALLGLGWVLLMTRRRG
jgi:hypothetical protein